MFGRGRQSCTGTLHPSATRLLITSTHSQGELSRANCCCSALQSGQQDTVEMDERRTESGALVSHLFNN